VAEVIRVIKPDIIGLQEVADFTKANPGESEQLAYLRSDLSEYAFSGIGAPALVPCENPMLYDPDRLEVVDEGYFFFSSRPDELYSVSWAAGQPVFASWALFRDLRADETDGTEDRRLWVFNVHYDHLSGMSRRNSSRILNARIRNMVPESEPVVVIGDFNAFPWSASIRLLEHAGLRHALPQTPGTFHAFKGTPLWPRIDHILVSDGLVSRGGLVFAHGENGIYPSDHFPVFAVLEYAGSK
jgi:endonuclease/exonuclease/phosphatase family metal-dependent hydrolase